MQSIRGASADAVWSQAVAYLLKAPTREGRGGAVAELLHVVLSLSNPRDRWLSVRVPALNPAFALVEVLWILGGRRDAALPTFWNPVLPRYAGHDAEFHGAYGWRLRRQFGIDQLSRAADVLRARPESRQVVLQIWDVSSDLPRKDGSEAAADIPCNTSSHLKVRDGRLHWLQIMRSNDAYRGAPHNLVQFTILQEVIAAWLDAEVGDYTVVIDSFHGYQDTLSRLEASLMQGERCESDLPRFAIPRAESEAAFKTMLQAVDDVRASNSMDRFRSHLQRSLALPADWPSAMSVIIADAARRQGLPTIVEEAQSACANPLLAELWRRWRARREGGGAG